jgi:hypothetical protein
MKAQRSLSTTPAVWGPRDPLFWDLVSVQSGEANSNRKMQKHARRFNGIRSQPLQPRYTPLPGLDFLVRVTNQGVCQGCARVCARGYVATHVIDINVILLVISMGRYIGYNLPQPHFTHLHHSIYHHYHYHHHHYGASDYRPSKSYTRASKNPTTQETLQRINSRR